MAHCRKTVTCFVCFLLYYLLFHLSSNHLATLNIGTLINTHSEKTLIRQLSCLEDVLNTLSNEKKSKMLYCKISVFAF